MDSDHPTPNRQDPERERIPLERKISLKFKEFRGFITEYSANISEGGMFITTDAPQPPGAVFDFEFRLTDDDFQIIHGIGEVVWVRDEPAGPDQPPGMGIRFLHLAEGSRDLIRRMVDEHERSGGTPFDLESQAPEAPAVAGPAAELADTATLDVPPDEKTDSERPEEGYGLPPTGAPGREDEPLLSPAAETPDRAPTDDSERAPGEEAGDESGLPYQRFDAAMASLRERRAREAGEKDLPAGFGEVQAALGDRDADAEEEAASFPAGRFPDSSDAEALPIRDPDFVPPDLPPAEPRRESQRRDLAAGGAGRSQSRTRWLVLTLLVLAALAVAGHFLLPGGLPGIPGVRRGTAEAAPAAPIEEPGRADPLTPPVDETAPMPETLDAEIVEEPQTAPPTEPTIDEGETGRVADEAREEAGAMPAPAAGASGEPFTRVENVGWRVEGGRTVVELLLDGEVSEDRYSHYRLDGGSPRELVRLDGVSAPYSPSSLDVTGDQVSQIRIGYHQKPGGNELHVVLDLASSDVELTELEAAAGRIRLVVGPSGAPP